MKPTTHHTNKSTNTAGIILLVVSFLFIAITVRSIYISTLTRSTAETGDAGAGIVYIGYWMANSLTSFIAVVLLCLSIPLLSGVKKPDASILGDETASTRYRQKTNLLGILWLLAPCVAVLLYTFAPDLGRLQIFALEPIYFTLIVFGLLNAARYSLWSRAANRATR